MKRLAWLACVVSVLGCAPGDRAPEGVAEGDRAPNVEGITAENQPVRLESYKGKVVLIDFWATWCGPCVASLGDEIALVKEMEQAGRPFAVLGVSRDRSAEALKGFLTRRPLPWANIHDADGKTAEQWGVEYLPTFVLVGKDGVIVRRWVGAAKWEQIKQAVADAAGK